MASVIQNRYDFMVIFDVTNGNPNGDPDAGNAPRMDAETGIGLVTDVCIKRKIRNYVEFVYGNKPGFDIYVRQGIPLNIADLNACTKAGLVPADTKYEKLVKALGDAKKADDMLDAKIMEAACAIYYDVRAFGAVMTSFKKAQLGCSQVRGPVQFGFARSVDPIAPQEFSVTRMTQATEKDMDEKGTNTFGQKWIVPYGLYCMEGYISACLANKLDGPNHTGGFSEEDLAILWEAILNMFEHDRSAARGTMVVRKLIVFKHDSVYGNAPSHELFERVIVKRKAGVEIPRHYGDYEVSVVMDNLPNGVTCDIMV